MAYIIESNRRVREVEVLKDDGQFAVVSFKDTGGAIRVRVSRVHYDTPPVMSESKREPDTAENTKTHYDYEREMYQKHTSGRR